MNEAQTHTVHIPASAYPYTMSMKPDIAAHDAMNNHIMHSLFAALTGIGTPGDVPEGAKTVLRVYNRNMVADVCENNKVAHSNVLMPDIVDVSIVEANGVKKVVFVKFSDGTVQKAVLSDDDTFSLEQGISICVTKKLFDMKAGNGSSLYNKVISRGLKVYSNTQKEKAKQIADAAEKKAKVDKAVAKKRAKRLKREAAAREAQIEIQKEAYLRAMRENNSTSQDVASC